LKNATRSFVMTFAALARKLPPGHHGRLTLLRLEESPLAIRNAQ
jgi:hypothetical protein